MLLCLGNAAPLATHCHTHCHTHHHKHCPRIIAVASVSGACIQMQMMINRLAIGLLMLYNSFAQLTAGLTVVIVLLYIPYLAFIDVSGISKKIA